MACPEIMTAQMHDMPWFLPFTASSDSFFSNIREETIVLIYTASASFINQTVSTAVFRFFMNPEV